MIVSSLQRKKDTVWHVEIIPGNWPHDHGFRHRYLTKYAAIKAYCRERVLRHCAVQGDWGWVDFDTAKGILLSHIAGEVRSLLGDELNAMLDLYDRFYRQTLAALRGNDGT